MRGCSAMSTTLAVDDVHLALRAGGQLRIMRHHHDGGPCAVQVLQQLHDGARHLGVEVAGGFVRQQQAWRPGQRARNRDPLLLAAGRVLPG